MLVQLSVIRHPYQQSLILDENCITLKAIGKPLSEMFEFRGEWNTSIEAVTGENTAFLHGPLGKNKSLQVVVLYKRKHK